MSSDVHAKWMNSAARAISGTPAKRSFSQYSTALTSWLVRALDRLDARRVGRREVARAFGDRVRASPRENGGTSAIAGSSESAASQRARRARDGG